MTDENFVNAAQLLILSIDRLTIQVSRIADTVERQFPRPPQGGRVLDPKDESQHHYVTPQMRETWRREAERA